MESWFRLIIQEYFELPTGFPIDQPDRIITLGKRVHFSRKTIKHLVDQRKKDGLSLEEIKILFERILEGHKTPDLRLPNTNKNYPSSFLLIKLYLIEERGVVIVHIAYDTGFLVITAFYRSVKKILKLKNGS